MSLVDALLLDPYPFDVWIATRTDGVKGSGTSNDPFIGSTQARFDGIMALFQTQSNVTIHLGPEQAAEEEGVEVAAEGAVAVG